MNHDVDTGLRELRQAHDMNPNCAVMLCWLAFYEAINGRAEAGMPLCEAGLRRSPRDPARGSMLCTLGSAKFGARDYDAPSRGAAMALAQ